MNKLAQKLKKTRESKSLTIAAQAERIGVSAGTLARLEAGKTDVTLDTMGKVAIALGLKVWTAVKLLKSA